MSITYLGLVTFGELQKYEGVMSLRSWLETYFHS